MAEPSFNQYPSKWTNDKMKGKWVSKEPGQTEFLCSILLTCEENNLYFCLCVTMAQSAY